MYRLTEGGVIRLSDGASIPAVRVYVRSFCLF